MHTTNMLWQVIFVVRKYIFRKWQRILTHLCSFLHIHENSLCIFKAEYFYGYYVQSIKHVLYEILSISRITKQKICSKQKQHNIIVEFSSYNHSKVKPWLSGGENLLQMLHWKSLLIASITLMNVMQSRQSMSCCI